MRFQELYILVTITEADGTEINTKVDVLLIAGGYDEGSVISELRKNHPNAIKIVLGDVNWVIKKS